MSRIFEALRHAQKETGRYGTIPTSVPLSALDDKESDQEKALLSLYHRTDSLLPNVPRKVLQFIGSREGEGASTIAREFGRITADKMNKKVLIFNGDQLNPKQHLMLGIAPKYGWEDVLRGDQAVDRVIYQVRESNLYVCPVSPNRAFTHHVFDSPKIGYLWKELKERFELIIVDSPPASASPDGMAISRNVDGIVLVVEAEKTRWPVAENTKQMIEKNGGKILGVVFNKRKYYIPDYIYRRL